ncbi:MAG TPA: metal-dependent hydrolase [Thermoanaerobaculia bacterium]|nr:metal-dependent hydrolase [Thermoanaerobaculia bacterium]
MHPTTHLLTGWCLAELDPRLTRREKAAITIAAAAPDLDGFGMLAELLTRDTARPLLWWTDYHHVLAHNLLFAVLFATLAAVLTSPRAGVLCGVAVHLHILGDLIGSRGPDGYQWPIPYLYPFRDRPQLVWSGQWFLNAWPNFVITAALIAMTSVLAWRRGYSVVGLVSRRADQAFVGVLRQRFGQPGNC